MSVQLQIEQTLLAIVAQRGPQSNACPSDVARAVSPTDWRGLMPLVRDAASRLALQGRVQITQRGQVVAPAGPWRGPIRIRLASSGEI